MQVYKFVSFINLFCFDLFSGTERSVSISSSASIYEEIERTGSA